jgi:hypothetical protein
MRKSLSYPRLKLWDEDRQQLVGFPTSHFGLLYVGLCYSAYN